jgi:hypothetical protein
MSKIEVNTVDVQCGSTLTLGSSGKTVQLATGASQTGFGRSGSVNWQTTPKTATFTAADGEGYFINSGSALTMNLPAGSAGAIVAVSDYARNFATHNFTISPNGSEKIGGVADDLKLDIDGQALTLVYVDGTKGWINVQNAEDTETGQTFITATGGTISTVCTNFKVHTFTGPGTFCVSALSTNPANNTVDYVVVAGGGGGGGGDYGGGTGGFRGTGGGGAGGFRVRANTTQNPGFSGSPANPVNATSGITVTASAFPITVGGGGTGTCGGPNAGGAGSTSTFSTISSAGGGGGGGDSTPTTAVAGGSGGGGGANNCGTAAGAAGNTPPVSPPQGNPGGNGIPSNPNGGSAGGGGGALAAGTAGSPSNNSTNGGAGGVGGGVQGFGTSGVNCGSNYFFSGGGGGGNFADGGTGGGGKAGRGSPAGGPQTGGAGTTNTGGGGGGSGGFTSDGAESGGNGGSGIVIIRYKFQ